MLMMELKLNEEEEEGQSVTEAITRINLAFDWQFSSATELSEIRFETDSG